MLPSTETVELPMQALLKPQGIAIVGLSRSDPWAPGNRFLAALRAVDYAGVLYAVNPKAASVEGLPTVPTLADLPEPVDYAFVGVAPRQVPEVVRSAKGRVRIIQVMSAGFGEAADGVDLQADLVGAARASGVRIIGPNCMGSYSPRGRLACIRGVSGEVGTVGVASQSGGLGMDMIRLGEALGVRYSLVSTLGNCADVDLPDMVDLFARDPQTRVIGAYIENASSGRRLFDALKRRGDKPFVALLGGRTDAGKSAAFSHTGGLATPNKVLRGMLQQAGGVAVDDLDAFLNGILALHTVRHRPKRMNNVLLLGNGGGSSVLAADGLTDAKFTLPPTPASEIMREVEAGLPPGMAIYNPVDVPGLIRRRDIATLQKVVSASCESSDIDAILLHFNTANFRPEDQDVARFAADFASWIASTYPDGPVPFLALRTDGDADLVRLRDALGRRLATEGVPVYSTIRDAIEGMRIFRGAVHGLARTGNPAAPRRGMKGR